MDLVSIITAVFLLILAIAIVCYLSWLLILPFVQNIKSQIQLSKYKKLMAQLSQADLKISQKKFSEAIKILKSAVFLDLFVKTELVDIIKEHHQNILSRCLIIADELETKATNVADVERLFMERSELQSLYIKAFESYSSLKDRRQQSGKEIPQWSKVEFKNKLQEISRELNVNQKLLEKNLAKFFEELQKNSSSSNIIYH